MTFYINSVSLKGIKCIDKKIDLVFSNKTVTKSFNVDKSNIKAIYGPNGAGKSGIVLAMFIYKRLVLDNEALFDQGFSKMVFNSINKGVNEFSIDVVFTKKNNESKVRTYKHSLVLNVKDDDVYISYEAFYCLSGKVIDDSAFKKIVEIKDGTISYVVDIKKGPLENLFIYKKSINLLNKTSICPVFVNTYKDENHIVDESLYLIDLYDLYMFGLNLNVSIEEADKHSKYIMRSSINKEDVKNKLLEYSNNIDDYCFLISNSSRDCVKKDKYNNYIKRIEELSMFIKVFKPSLDSIEIDRVEKGDDYLCKKIFVYKNYKIDIEFESNGIKKLVRLFNSFKAAANGEIVFIDELDANLHDVYLSKLLEFFLLDGKGQLCFTTHNLEPIELFKDRKHAIDFLSNDSRIYSWVREGNTSLKKRYVLGLIPYSPFNVESFDFDVLLDEDK